MSPEDVHAAIKEHGLCLPEAWEDHPWGETALKVRKKAFVFMGVFEGRFSMSVKLPVSAADALASWPGATPTGYGLGKHGWVSLPVEAGQADVDLDVLVAYVEESYRAVAPKTLARKI